MKSWIAWLLFAVICIYSVLDVYQTKLLFDLGACEANPLLRWLIDITGTWRVIILVKWIILVVMGIGIWMVSKRMKSYQTQGRYMDDKWYWKTEGVLIPVPDEDIPAVLEQISIEKLKIKKFLVDDMPLFPENEENANEEHILKKTGEFLKTFEKK